ncbi:MAG: hypothetical protein GY722_07365, partial [bacterium]|nr:hypothetical protein [bacterium]
YAYVRNSPINYVDPDGQAIDTIADIGFIAYDVGDIAVSLVGGDGVSKTQLYALGGDVLGAALPFVTGVGAAIRAGAHADDAVGAARALSAAGDLASGTDGGARAAGGKLSEGTSRATRREAMRREGLPTSQQPKSQSSPRGPGNRPAGRQLEYDTPDGKKLVQHQLQDRNHGPHWEAGTAKPGGQTDPAARPRLRNDKTRVNEDP